MSEEDIFGPSFDCGDHILVTYKEGGMTCIKSGLITGMWYRKEDMAPQWRVHYAIQQDAFIIINPADLETKVEKVNG